MFSLSRYRKQIMSVLMALVMAGSICFFEPMTVNAIGLNNGIEFYVNYPEPATSDYEGYIILLLRNNNTGEYALETLFWYCCATFNDYYNPCYMTVDLNPTLISFSPGGNTGSDSIYSISDIDATGRYSHLFHSSTERYYLNLGMFGWTIMSYKFAGNLNILNATGVDNTSNLFTVYFSQDGSAMLLMEIISLLQSSISIDSSILQQVTNIIGSVDGLENQLTSVINYLKSVDDKLPDIQDKLQNIYDKLDEILEEEKKQTSWLEKIWNSIQEFFSPSTEDQEVTDSLKENSQSQSNQLNDLNEQSKVEKVDPGSASASVDSYIDTAAVGTYGTVLSTFTGNNTVLQYLLIVFAVAFIGYVLFGKR